MISSEFDDVEENEVVEFPFGVDQDALQKMYRDKYFPLMQFAIAQQDLRKMRTSYFSRQLEKEKDLNEAIEQTTQEMRYLSRRLKELSQKIKSNYIYANVSGTIVGAKTPQVGFEYSAQEAVFKVQPVESEFQVGVLLEKGDAAKFSKGAETYLVLETKHSKIGVIAATSIGVFRQPNGQLEALLDLNDQAAENTEMILKTGYKGEGAQSIRADVTVGQERIWQSIQSSINHVLPFQIAL